MITSIAIENFKGIRDRVELELRPITLLFGPNSAGKSTILHAMHYAREVFVNRNVDSHQTEVGGEHVDLGGFRQFVHSRDLTNQVKLRVSASVDAIDSWYDKKSRYRYYTHLPSNLVNWMRQAENKGEAPEPAPPVESGLLFAVAVNSVSVEISVAWHEQREEPFVESFQVWINDLPVATVAVGTREPQRTEFVLREFNYEHPVLPPCFWRDERPGIPAEGEDDWLDDEFGIYMDELLTGVRATQEQLRTREREKLRQEQLRAQNREGFRQQHKSEYMEFLRKEFEIKETFPYWINLAKAVNLNCFKNGIPLHLSGHALPELSQAHFMVEPIEWDDSHDAVEGIIVGLAEELHKRSQEQTQKASIAWLSRLSQPEIEERLRGSFDAFALYANTLLAFAAETIREELKSFQYLGPLRKADYGGERSEVNPDPSRWASGKGAWDVMRSRGETFVTEVSHWLTAPECLNSGYSLVFEKYNMLAPNSPVWQEIFGDSESTFTRDEIKQRLNELLSQPRLFIVPVGSELRLRPSDVGVGISQVIPVLVSALDGTHRFNAIEQPELHLHPKLQTVLGELFIHAVDAKANQFLVETHSEHLILRLLRRVRETGDGDLPENHPGLRPQDVSVIYLEPSVVGTQATCLRIDDSGEFVDKWPQGFFAERAKELF